MKRPSAASALRDATRRLMVAFSALDEAHRPCGTALPAPHAWALLELHAAGTMTIGALAARLNIDRTNVSRLCVRLEALGEIDRVVHPEDARARLIQLSKKGSRVARAVEASSAAHFSRVIGHLDEDPYGLTRALDALAHAMSASRDSRLENPA